MAAKPVILAVDDDPQVLAAIRKDLRDEYAKDYRIVAASDGPSALDAVRELHRRGDEVALGHRVARAHVDPGVDPGVISRPSRRCLSTRKARVCGPFL